MSSFALGGGYSQEQHDITASRPPPLLTLTVPNPPSLIWFCTHPWGGRFKEGCLTTDYCCASGRKWHCSDVNPVVVVVCRNRTGLDVQDETSDIRFLKQKRYKPLTVTPFNNLLDTLLNVKTSISCPKWEACRVQQDPSARTKDLVFSSIQHQSAWLGLIHVLIFAFCKMFSCSQELYL